MTLKKKNVSSRRAKKAVVTTILVLGGAMYSAMAGASCTTADNIWASGYCTGAGAGGSAQGCGYYGSQICFTCWPSGQCVCTQWVF
jgi:hypothetical protein